ncbi:MAG TPA: O-antigen ligase family protein, partial [Phycisphaerae bacterium]|nr:O-antigen ligase family protein [Phycisphaerae bacterium]
MFALLALIPIRAISSETHTFELLRWLRNLEAPSGATPATTLGIFAVIAAIAIVIMCARLWRGGGRYLRTGAELGAVLLLVAGVISTRQAGQKHLAVTGTVDFLGLVLYMLALRQVLTRAWHIRLAVTVVLATGVMIVTKCVYQRLVEMPMTIEYYKEYKPELTQADAAAGDDTARAGAQYDYEQRLYARTVSGYFQHPNVLASYLILIMTTSLAVAVSRFRRRPSWTMVMPVVLAAGTAVAFAWAQSKGAVLALGVALLLWAVGGWVVRRKPSPVTRRRLVMALWVAFVLGAVGLVAVLKSKPDSLGRSMLFRSMYWRGAWNMLVDQGPWGVGADNFGRYFTRYKPLECPEDVDDPHSWVMKAVSEWGVVGLAGLVLVLAGFSWRVAGVGDDRRGVGGDVHGQTGAARSGAGERPGGSIILWLAAIGGAILLWSVWLCLGANPAYVALTLCVLAFPWAAGFVAMA